MVHETLTTRLLAAKDFIEVAAVVCAVVKHEMGAHQSMVVLQALDGRPLLGVDDIVTLTDEMRLAYMVDTWRLDPFQRAMREHQAPVGAELMDVDASDELIRRDYGYRGDKLHILTLPLLQPGELLGIIRVGYPQPLSSELRRDLTTLSGHVSVRLAQLGITTLPDPYLEKLTPRQRDVAQLCARGLTNADIGHALELSENTVKKHLKDIFDLLGVANRTELATKLPIGPQHDVPVGVTRRGGLWITRGA